MKLFKSLFFVLIFTISLSLNAAEKKTFGIVVHGGAGTMSRNNMSEKLEKKYVEKLNEALKAGYKLLEGSEPAVDAVQAAINILEDSPLFNAGRGAVFNSEGENELDASIMDGRTLNAGAVAAVRSVRNPINLARLVMDKSPHVMLTGKGAVEFGKKYGIALAGDKYFFTQKRWDQYKKKKNEAKKNKSSEIILNHKEKYGTVGAAALDKFGNLAAGTSTGGLTYKRFGRIGDSPIIGAGTYANNNTCAVSATGTGEYFIRRVIAYDISALMEYSKMSLEKAANNLIHKKLTEMGGDGGVIGIDKNGNVTMVFNTEGMYRGYLVEGKEPVVKIYKK